MKLEEIGFYTLSEERVKNASSISCMQRGEIILSSRCNFSCVYCRNVGGKDIPLDKAEELVKLWAKDNLQAIRFSGGEPTIYPYLQNLVKLSKELGIKRIAISTNGTAKLDYYKKLIELGVNDFSISLDACCAEDGDKIAGEIKGSWDIVVDNIRKLSKLTYVTVGVVLTSINLYKINDIIKFADSLGVSDIRIIPAAQEGNKLQNVFVEESILNKYPILKYRINNIQKGLPVRGISENDNDKCPLVLDDSMVMGVNGELFCFPCVIYAREKGKPICKVGENMRSEREKWYKNHNTKKDKICSSNCLDCLVLYNNKYKEYHEKTFI